MRRVKPGTYRGIQSVVILVFVPPVLTSATAPAAGILSSSPARRELADFLRTRRERLRPADVGLPTSGRRRTPGLRREEVAQLANVGVTWYTWLEQGRDIRPSAAVLEGISAALRLDPGERAHLWTLATGGAPGPAAADSACAVVTEDHLALLGQLLPVPACIQTARFDILASNAAYRFLFGDVDAQADGNCLVRAFLDPTWRNSYVDFPTAAARMVARLRTSMTAHLDDPAWTQLVERLRDGSPLFAQLWDRHELTVARPEFQRFRLPDERIVSVRFTRLWLDTAAGVRVNVLQPVSAADADLLEELAASVSDAPAVTTRPAVTARLSDFAVRRSGATAA
jgi:transcriptional regulator with XRE-family HTH domain